MKHSLQTCHQDESSPCARTQYDGRMLLHPSLIICAIHLCKSLCSYFDSCDRRNCLYSLTSNSFISTSNRSANFSKLPRSGWEELVHHLLTVDGVTPSCSANQRAVRFFSNSTIFIRLISSISMYFDGTKIVKIIQFLALKMKLSYRFDTFLWFLMVFAIKKRHFMTKNWKCALLAVVRVRTKV